MNGTNRGAIRAYAAFSNDLIDLIVKDYPLDLFEDPFPILEAQPDPVWAGHPVWSRNAVKLMSALLPVVEGRFDCNPYVHGSPPYKELTLAQARSPTTTPMFCPLPFEHHAAMTPLSLRAFLHEYRIRFPVAVDMTGERGPLPQTMEAYALEGTPTLLLIDREGRLRARHFGTVSDLALEAEIMALVLESTDAG